MSQKLSSIICLLSDEKGIRSYSTSIYNKRGFLLAWDGHGITHLALDFQDQHWRHSLWFSWGDRLSYSGIEVNERTELKCDPSDFSIINKHNVFCYATWFAVADRITRRAGIRIAWEGSEDA